ncbi:hypothetical protein ACIBEA_40400 [Streptomyces sp. NPDC051555]|uniref:hypothetical protein n=1 Tax=Streptomyces sp. NPDC051555 TaxID=3365657 RepID=UPI00379592A4
MTIPRRPLGHGPQSQHDHAAQAPEAAAAHRVRAAEADIAAHSLHRPGSMEDLDRLRERGVLGTPPRPEQVS